MRNEDFDFIIDTPGSLTLQGLLPLVFEADAVIVPILLEKTSINSTTSFIEMCAMVAKENGGNKLPDFYFVPNQFNKNWGRKAELTEQQTFLDYFAKLGTVLPKIPNCAEIQRYSTLSEFYPILYYLSSSTSFCFLGLPTFFTLTFLDLYLVSLPSGISNPNV